MEQTTTHRQRSIRRWIRRLWVIGLACVVAYTLVPVLILRFGFDTFVLHPSGMETTHEDWRHVVLSDDGRGVAIRRYGEANHGKCVVFFPGQHGGMARYERDLLPQLHVEGYSLYAMSYPGQDGAPGRGSLDHLEGDLDRAFAFLGASHLCRADRSVFVGRSLGASLAILEAWKLRPKGVLVEGVSPDLATTVRAWMKRHTLTWAWQWLPVASLLPVKGDLQPLINAWDRTIPMIVFQGTADEVTPFESARALLIHRPGITFNAVVDGKHENAFRVAKPDYRAALIHLAGF